MALSRSECAVMMITGTCGQVWRTWASRPRPSMPGIRMSVRMALGGALASLARAASALSKTKVCRSAWASALSSTQRMDWSSSMIQTSSGLGMGISWRSAIVGGRKGHQDFEDGLPRLALAFDQAAVLLHDGLGNGQPQAGALGAPGDHGVEHRLAQLGADAGAVVLDLYLAQQGVAARADGEAAQHARTDQHARRQSVGRLAGGHFQQALHGVAHDVEKDLNQLVGIGPDLGQAGIVIAHQLHGIARFGLQDAAYALQNLVDVYPRKGGGLAGTQHPVGQGAQAVGLVDDDGGVFAQLGAVQLAL